MIRDVVVFLSWQQFGRFDLIRGVFFPHARLMTLRLQLRAPVQPGSSTRTRTATAALDDLRARLGRTRPASVPLK